VGWLPPFLTVYAVAHFAAKPPKTPQNDQFVFRWEYYLADFKTAAFSHSATPPHESITLMKTTVKASFTAHSRHIQVPLTA